MFKSQDVTPLRSPLTVASSREQAVPARSRLTCACNALNNDNDNDNDTLREVPHPSNEGLALQARVSGPWPHKKESVLLVELARWQGVQVHTVKRQSVVQQYLK